MKNLFDVIPEKFFGIFTGENKRVHADIMSCIYNTLNDNTTILKQDLLDALENFCEENELGRLTDELGNDISDVSNKDKARAEYNIFKRNSWLNDEIVKDYSTLVTFDDNAISVMKLLEEIRKDDKQLEYTGYVRMITKLVLQFDYIYSTLEQLYKNTKELSIELGKINSSIRKYLNKLLRENSNDLNKLLEDLLGTYQENIVGKAFTNLKTRDNPTKYKFMILDRLETILLDHNVDRLVLSYKEIKNVNISDDEIREQIITELNYIYDKFDNIEETISLIDTNNSKYVTNTTSKCKFLLSEGVDISGTIDSILKDLKDIDNEDFFEGSFGLYSESQIDEDSMYIPSKKTVRSLNNKLAKTIEIDETELLRRQKQLFKPDYFSVDAVNQYVLGKLLTTDSFLASEIISQETISITRIVLIRLYSNNKKTKYKIKALKNVTRLGFNFEDYSISRKED